MHSFSVSCNQLICIATCLLNDATNNPEPTQEKGFCYKLLKYCEGLRSRGHIASGSFHVERVWIFSSLENYNRRISGLFGAGVFLLHLSTLTRRTCKLVCMGVGVREGSFGDLVLPTPRVRAAALLLVAPIVHRRDFIRWRGPRLTVERPRGPTKTPSQAVMGGITKMALLVMVFWWDPSDARIW